MAKKKSVKAKVHPKRAGEPVARRGTDSYTTAAIKEHRKVLAAEGKKKKPTPSKTGRKRAKLDWKQIAKFCFMQMVDQEIEYCAGADITTIQKECLEVNDCTFSAYKAKHSAGGRASLRRVQFEKATMDKDNTQLIWLGKQYLNQSDKGEIMLRTGNRAEVAAKLSATLKNANKGRHRNGTAKR